MAKASGCFADSLRFLKWFETHWELEVPVKAKFHTLRLKVSFLKAFFSCTGKWHIDDKNLQVHLWHIHKVVYDATNNLILSRSKCLSSQEKLYHIISGVIEKIDTANPHIQQVYAIVSKSRRSRSTCSKVNAVIDLVHVLLKNMKKLFSWKAHSILPLRKEIEALEENLRFIKYFLRLSKIWCNIDEMLLNDLLTHAESVGDSTACILYLCCEESKMDDDMVEEMKDEISCLVQKFKPFQPNVREIYIKALKASESLQQENNIFLVDELVLDFLYTLLGHMIDISKVKVNFKRFVVDKIEVLHEELQIVRNYLLDPSALKYTESNKKVSHLLSDIKVVVSRAAYAIYTCYDSDITEEMAEELNLEIADLLQEIEVIKKEARDIYDKLIAKSLRSNFPKTNELGFIDFEIIAKSLRSNFPRTNELGFIDFVIQNLHELLSSKVDSIVQLHHQIETVLGSILSLKEDFFEIAKLFREHEQQRDPWTRFKDIVYQTEIVLDSSIARSRSLWVCKLGLFDIMQQIKVIRREVNAIKTKRTTDTSVLKFSISHGDGVSSLANSGSFVALQGPNYDAGNETNRPNDHVEIFVDEAKKITDQLTNGSTDLCILSIVGMPGIGKTTLGNSVYENPLVPLCFHARARCHVTHAYQKRRLLLEILQQICGQNDQVRRMTDDDLAQNLYQSLKGKKYFIFLDDLWDIRPWNDMRASFPDDKIGSRIMFTSRFHNIALETGSKSATYPLNPISDSKTWKLLQVKLFGKESCPQELVKVGQQIAAKCKGLTLSADLIAGLLRTTGRETEHWAKIANSLNTHLLEDRHGRCMHILELSYNQLPDHLKPCFLYFGAFPENKEVPTSKLMWLWIAEGFIQLRKDDEGSSEDVARNYLNDLIARSLVIDSKRGSYNGVKASRVHDLLHDFALAKAKEECFLQHTAGSHTLYQSYRLCIYSNWERFAASNPFGPRLRSLVSSAPGYTIFGLFENIKLLRVLDLLDIYFAYSPCIFQLVHLKFLSLRNDSRRMPPEIGNLQNLETLLVRSCRRMKLPNTIWNLVRLRYFKVIDGSCILPRCSPEFMEKSFKLNSLNTLSTPYLFLHEDVDKIMRGFPNLRKLSCIFLDSWDYSSNCNRFPILDFLTGLDSLSVVYGDDQVLRHPCEFYFPHSLKKLKLSNFRLPWTAMSTIGKLPNLEVLKLADASFQGKTWDMTEGEFLKLKFLKLVSLDIAHWNALEDHLIPCLETLVVKHCTRLVEIPPCLGDIPTLQRLELENCTHSAWISARTVKEKQEDMGNDQIVVTLIE